MEALAGSGAFDNIGEIKRGQYFGKDAREISFIELLIRYGNKFQSESSTTQQSLFGESGDLEISKPEITIQEEWPKLVKLDMEKDLIGIYLSAHPLDTYKLEKVVRPFPRISYTEAVEILKKHAQAKDVFRLGTMGSTWGILVKDKKGEFWVQTLAFEEENGAKVVFTVK